MTAHPSRFVRTLVYCVLLSSSQLSAHAALTTLVAGNSSVAFDPLSQAGVSDWLVDGVDHLKQQWFWYRVGATGGEASIDTLTLSSIATSDLDSDPGDEVANLLYTGTGFTVAVQYTLAGGSFLSGVADLAEEITITNTTAASLDLTFFQYSDFDLQGTANNDEIAIVGNTAFQFDLPTAFSETVDTPMPAHVEGKLQGVTLAKLNDAFPTTLDGQSAAGPGDVTWAFQWDFLIPTNGGQQILKNKFIAGEPQTPAVPEPSALLIHFILLATAGLKRSLRCRR